MTKTINVPVFMFTYFVPHYETLKRESLKDNIGLDKKIVNEISFWGPREEDLFSAGHDLIKICGMPPYIAGKKGLVSKLVQPYGKKPIRHINPPKGFKIVDA